MPWRREKPPTPVFWPGELNSMDNIVHGFAKSWTLLSKFQIKKKKKSNSSYCLEVTKGKGITRDRVHLGPWQALPTTESVTSV